MEWFWDLRRSHKKAWYFSWALTAVVVVAVGQWQMSGRNPLLTEVLGAQAKQPDTAPPAVSVSFPRMDGDYSSEGWASACSPVGVCGSASDTSGIGTVQVAAAASNGRYWDPGTATFSSTTAAWMTANGKTSWNLPWARPADGSYTLYVRATDTAAPVTNTSVPIAVRFVVDTAAPPAPTLTAQPDDPSFDRSFRFAFSHAEAGVLFECRLDDGPAEVCGKSINYKNVGVGDHSFSVSAIDAAGNRSEAARFAWAIVENKAFGISGSVTDQLFPGVTRALDLALGNPYNFAITITSVTVTVEPQTTKTTGGANRDCIGTENLEVTQQLVGPVTLPANSTRSLSQLDVAQFQRPQLTMLNLPVNQDACKNTAFKLSYSGTAQKS